MTDPVTTAMTEIRSWHEQDRRVTLERTFALGDLIHRAVIHTGLNESQVVTHIIDDLGAMAMSPATYNRAARIARVFTAKQRLVLLDKAVPLLQAEVLAGKHYENPPTKRTKTLHAIKTGAISSPWDKIQGVRESKRRVSAADVTTVTHDPRVVEAKLLNEDGALDEGALIGLYARTIQLADPVPAQKCFAEALKKVIAK